MKPVSRTAFYCSGVRALDARKPRPACGDQYAERFMDDEAWKTFEPFRRLTGPNVSNATRHRIIDDLLRPIHRKLVELGASFQHSERPLAELFADEHYTQAAHVSVAKRAAELGQWPLFLRLYARFDRVFQQGYSVRVFTPE